METSLESTRPNIDSRAPGHYFHATTALGSSRVHMGDVHGGQHNHYHATTSLRSDPEELSLQDALAFEQMHFRSSTIAPSYAKTCDWVFKASPYKRWRNQSLVSEHNGFLWIKGKPGAGKSTVMKHMCDYARSTYEHEKTLSFFFNARGAAMGKSIEGMYRCLLHQLAGQVLELSNNVSVLDRKAYKEKGWPIGLLQNLFQQAVLHLCSKTRLSCYIDALDEGDDEEQVREMVDFFYELAEVAVSSSMSFSICLASRYYPQISVTSFEEFRLEVCSGHDDDILAYLHNKLRLENEQLKRHMTSQIRCRSSGIFLWVVLVVAMLNKEIDHGNQHLLWARLQEIPDGLLALLEDIRTRDASDNRFIPAIQCVLYALRPLKPKELYYAILTSVGQLNVETVIWDPQIVNARVVNDLILSSSKGLLEIGLEPASSIDVAERPVDQRVQFIHEVVREYFLNASTCDAESIDSEYSTALPNEIIHDLYPLQRPFEQSAPVTSGAVPSGGSSSAEHPCTTQSEAQPGENLLGFGEPVFRSRGPDKDTQLGWVYCGNAQWTRVLNTKDRILQKLYRGGFARLDLSLAINNDDASANFHNRFSRICQAYIRISYASELDQRRKGRDTILSIGDLTQTCVPFLDYSVKFVLSHAELASRRWQQVANLEQMFPWDGWVFFKSADYATLAESYRCMYTWLQLTTCEHYPHLVRDELARVSAESKHLCRGREFFNSLLNACSRNLGSALHIAAAQDDLVCAKLLLNHGANPDTTCKGIGTPLHSAVLHSKDRAVRLLLKHGANQKAADEHGNSPLHFAIMQKDVKIIESLVEYGADFDHPVGIYGNAIQTAGHSSDRKFMELLVGIGAIVD